MRGDASFQAKKFNSFICFNGDKPYDNGSGVIMGGEFAASVQVKRLAEFVFFFHRKGSIKGNELVEGEEVHDVFLFSYFKPFRSGRQLKYSLFANNECREVNI